MNTKIYYDGVNIDHFIHEVDGVTTNTSYIAGEGITDYNKFIQWSLDVVGDKPISFQVTERSLEGIEQQARFLGGMGEMVYVKIPILLPNGESTSSVITKLSNDGLKINATCIHTHEQIDEAVTAINKETPSIISVFAGGISDAGNYPKEFIAHAVELSRPYENMEVLWAGCQRVLSIVEASDLGCDIVTVPDAILSKRDRIGASVYETSLKKSNTFFNDGDILELYLEK